MRRAGIFALAGLVLAVALAVFVSPFASSSPDGMERVATDHGFEGAARDSAAGAPMPDYQAPGVRNPKVAIALAGLVGTVTVFAAGHGLGRLIAARRSRPK